MSEPPAIYQSGNVTFLNFNRRPLMIDGPGSEATYSVELKPTEGQLNPIATESQEFSEKSILNGTASILKNIGPE